MFSFGTSPHLWPRGYRGNPRPPPRREPAPYITERLRACKYASVLLTSLPHSLWSHLRLKEHNVMTSCWFNIWRNPCCLRWKQTAWQLGFNEHMLMNWIRPEHSFSGCVCSCGSSLLFVPGLYLTKKAEKLLTYSMSFMYCTVFTARDVWMMHEGHNNIFNTNAPAEQGPKRKEQKWREV